MTFAEWLILIVCVLPYVVVWVALYLGSKK